MLGQKLDAKVVITGASGFIGRRLRDALLAAGAEVVSIRRKGSPESDRGRSVVADYADVSALRALFSAERPELVFHVAGVTKGVTYADFQRGNVEPTRNLLQAIADVHPGLSRFVHVSSLTSYGPSRIGQPHVESNERRPIEHYGRSKLEAEKVVESFGDQLAWTIVRPGGVYGPGDVDYFNLFKSITQGFNLYFGNRQRMVSNIYVDDCVRATVEAGLSPSTKGKGYFLCDGRPVTWQEFQELIAKVHGRRVRDLDFPEVLVDFAALGGELLTRLDKKPRLFNRQKAKMGAQEAWTCTHRAAREAFGYVPKVPMEDGVRRSFDWYKREGWIKS